MSVEPGGLTPQEINNIICGNDDTSNPMEVSPLQNTRNKVPDKVTYSLDDRGPFIVYIESEQKNRTSSSIPPQVQII